MERRTIEHLASLHRALYRDRAEAFSATRQRPWRGWTRLLEVLEARRALPDRPSVLDVGCGNGRFARFLGEHLGRAFTYVGVDESAPLLAEARVQAERAVSQRDMESGRPNLLRPGARGTEQRGMESVRLVAGDLISESMDAVLAREGLLVGFDLVVAMGVLHHVPSAALRASLMQCLARRVAPGGALAVSFWELEEAAAFRRRVPWPEYLERSGHPFSEDELEPGDHLLPFGDDALRYCHHASAEEQAALVAASGLLRVATFEADQRNRYVVLAPR